MKKCIVFSNRGFTYLECVVAMAVIGICALILFSSFRSREVSKKKFDQQTRAISALVSEADLIRSGEASREAGRHDFALAEKLLLKLASGRGSYTVSRLPQTPHLLRVLLRVTWRDQELRHKDLEIYVHE